MVVTAFTAVLVLVFVGFCPSQATRCTRENLQKCVEMEGVTGCKLFQDVSDCLENIEGNCTDDTLKDEVFYNFKSNEMEADPCQGLPEGECFHSAWRNCEKMAPPHVVLSRTSDVHMKAYCDNYAEQNHSFKTCLDGLKSCKSDGAYPRVAVSLNVAEQVLERCKLF